MKWLGPTWLGVALALGLGIAAYAIDRGSADGTSGIRGIVLVGPSCPGPLPAPLPPGTPPFRTDCPDKPIAIELQVADENGRTVASVTSDAAGGFAVALSPGTYTIRGANKGLPAVRPQQVVVPQGRWVEVTVRADSGIR